MCGQGEEAAFEVGLRALWNRTSLWRNRLPKQPDEDERPGYFEATRSGYARLLRKSGFPHQEYFLPWPDPVRWTRLLREDAPPDAFPLPDTSRKQKIGKLVFRGASRVGQASRLAPSYCIVARQPSESPHLHAHDSPSILEKVARRIEVEPSSVIRLDAHPNSKSLTFTTEDHFVKIPLTHESAECLTRAARITRRSRAGPRKGSPFILSPSLRTYDGAFMIGMYPCIPHDDPNTDWADKVFRLRYAIEQLAHDAQDMPLGTTDFWQRLMSKTSSQDLASVGGGEMAVHFERSAASKVVPAGLIHGDLAWGNLIRDRRTGEIILIDWDRCEERSPKFLDIIHACHSLARTHDYLVNPESRANRIFIAWEMIIARDPAIPLLEQADSMLGELSWEEAIGLAILNEVEQHLRGLRPTPVLRAAHEEGLRERITLARDCLDPVLTPGRS